VRRYTVAVDGQPYTIDVEETAADRFRVTVGDRTFEACLERDEDLPGAAIEPGMPAGPAAAVEPPGLPEAVSPSAHRVPAGQGARAGTDGGPATPPPRVTAGTPGLVAGGARAEALAAPMPGVVLDVHVAPGAVLRRGDAVLVLEAMKMRNTIRAPRAAEVVAVEVEAGQPVAAGDVLVRLGPPPG
jgi:glutaconyl-CoA decarboxylase